MKSHVNRKRKRDNKPEKPPEDTIQQDDQLNNSNSNNNANNNPEPERLLKALTDLTILYYGSAPTLFQGKKYELITHEINFFETSSVVSKGRKNKKGEHIREHIFLDMESEALEKTFKKFIKLLNDTNVSSQALTPINDEEEVKSTNDESLTLPATPFAIIPNILKFVNAELNGNFSEEKMQTLASENNEISLEKVIENKMGVCRHKALLTAYLLVQAVRLYAKENDITDITEHVYHARYYLAKLNDKNKFEYSPHAGVVFITADNKKYFLDASNSNGKGVYAFFEFSDDLTLLKEAKQYYGKYLFDPFWKILNDYYPSSNNITNTHNNNINKKQS